MKEIINDLLGYEGLKIVQTPETFNFSLDSTILGYYVTLTPRNKMIVDLGCGNGYIPIFLSLRTKEHIYGVEIQEEVSKLAKKSVDINNLNEQITIINEDMKTVHNTIGVAQADVVVSNPPYFKVKNTSLLNDSTYKTIARHEVNITLDEVIHTANVLLKDGGTFAMVHRASRMLDIFESLRKNGFEPKRMLFVYSKKTSDEAQVIFIESKKSKNLGELKILPPLYVYEENNEYTEDILKIFNYKPR